MFSACSPVDRWVCALSCIVHVIVIWGEYRDTGIWPSENPLLHNFFWKRTEIISDISNIPSDDCDDDKGNVENDDVEADRVLVMLRRQEMHPRWNSGGGTNQGPGGTLFNYQKEHVMPTAGVGLIAPSASSKLFYVIFYLIRIFEFINFGGLVIGQNLKKKKSTLGYRVNFQKNGRDRVLLSM